MASQMLNHPDNSGLPTPTSTEVTANSGTPSGGYPMEPGTPSGDYSANPGTPLGDYSLQDGAPVSPAATLGEVCLVLTVLCYVILFSDNTYGSF